MSSPSWVAKVGISQPGDIGSLTSNAPSFSPHDCLLYSGIGEIPVDHVVNVQRHASAHNHKHPLTETASPKRLSCTPPVLTLPNLFTARQTLVRPNTCQAKHLVRAGSYRVTQPTPPPHQPTSPPAQPTSLQRNRKPKAPAFTKAANRNGMVKSAEL